MNVKKILIYITVIAVILFIGWFYFFELDLVKSPTSETPFAEKVKNNQIFSIDITIEDKTPNEIVFLNKNNI